MLEQLPKTLCSLWKDQTTPFLEHYKTLEVFTAKCRNRLRVSGASEVLVDLPLMRHEETPFNGHSADSGCYVDPQWCLVCLTVRALSLSVHRV